MKQTVKSAFTSNNLYSIDQGWSSHEHAINGIIKELEKSKPERIPIRVWIESMHFHVHINMLKYIIREYPLATGQYLEYEILKGIRLDLEKNGVEHIQLLCENLNFSKRDIVNGRMSVLSSTAIFNRNENYKLFVYLLKRYDISRCDVEYMVDDIIHEMFLGNYGSNSTLDYIIEQLTITKVDILNNHMHLLKSVFDNDDVKTLKYLFGKFNLGEEDFPVNDFSLYFNMCYEGCGNSSPCLYRHENNKTLKYMWIKIDMDRRLAHNWKKIFKQQCTGYSPSCEYIISKFMAIDIDRQQCSLKFIAYIKKQEHDGMNGNTISKSKLLMEKFGFTAKELNYKTFTEKAMGVFGWFKFTAAKTD